MRLASAAGVRGDQLAILRAQIFGDDGHLDARLHVDEVARVGERKIDLARIEQVEDDHVVAAPAHVARARERSSSAILVEIRDQHDETATAERLRQLLERREQRRLARRRPSRRAPFARSGRATCRICCRCLADGGT